MPAYGLFLFIRPIDPPPQNAARAGADFGLAGAAVGQVFAD